jgi:hypothetical protein
MIFTQGAFIYQKYQTIALSIGGTPHLAIGKLDARHLIRMAAKFKIKNDVLINMIELLNKNLTRALTAIEKSSVGNLKLRQNLIKKMEKRWNGSFLLIGQQLLKKQNKDAKN